MTDFTDKMVAINALNRATYSLTAADGRLRGRATRIPGAVSMAHARTLKALAEEGDLSVKELAIRTETTAAGVTQLINGLEQAGYVERLRSDHDRRVVTIRLTPTGLERHQNREKEIQRILSDTLSDYNAKQIEQSAEIIKRMIYVLDQL